MRRGKAASLPQVRIPTRRGAMVRAGGWNAAGSDVSGMRE